MTATTLQANRTNESKREEGPQVAALRADYQQVCARFDELAEQYYEAEELHELICAFLERHKGFLGRVRHEYPAAIRSLMRNEGELVDGRRANESMLDDLAILNTIECRETKPFEPQEDSSYTENNINHLLADIFRRASRAKSALSVYRKWRHKEETDRREPLKFAQLAIRHNPNDFEACQWYEITSGRYSDTAGLGARERISSGEAFKRSILRCLRLRPEDALSHNLLGRYYFAVAELSWMQRAFLHGLSNFKLEGTFKEAEREFRRGDEIKPGWMPVGLWMARVLLAQRRPMSEVRHWVEMGLRAEVLEPQTEMEREELVELAKKHGLDCRV